MRRFVVCLVLFAAVLPASTLTFQTLPAGGTISGSDGSIIGWGYSITNNSTDQWLVTTALNSDSFVAAVPTVLFDFPILSPGATVTEAFDPVHGTGLMQLLLDSSLSGQVINTGNFVLASEWWNGDPFNGGSYVSDGATTSQSYQAVSSVPEPSTVALTIVGSAMFCVAGLRRSRTCRIRRS